MKYAHSILIAVTLVSANMAFANEFNLTLSQDNMKVSQQLYKNDSIHIKYDLSRHPIYRQHEWYSYALFCYVHGKATITYPLNQLPQKSKLPILVSEEETNDQVGIGKKIDGQGELIIENVSEFDAGSLIECGLYPKFGE